MNHIAQKTFEGLLAITLGGWCIVHFFIKWRQRRKAASLALMFLCAGFLLCTVPLFEVVPRDLLWVFRWLTCCAFGFLVWSIKRVEGIATQRELKGETLEDVERWREDNREYLEIQARRRRGGA